MSTNLQQLQQRPAARQQVAEKEPEIVMGFGNQQGFELMQRAANVLTNSTLVPTAYRNKKEIKSYGKVTGHEENKSGMANCIVALNMAQRMQADPLMVMQNLHIIEGRPSWSSQFIIAAINSCGRYSPLRFELTEAAEPTELTYSATEWKNNNRTEVQKTIVVRHQECVAYAIEKETGQRLDSPRVSIQMAIDEGWLTKNGSKWQTMPELMLRYRCASMFGRLYAPELLMGLQSSEEAHDYIEAEKDAQGDYSVNVDQLRSAAADSVDIDTGEIIEQENEPEPAKPKRQARKPEPAQKAKQEPEELPEQRNQEEDDFDFDME